jgi:hypothetical protein
MRQRYSSLLILLLAIIFQMSAQTLNDRYNRQRPVVIILDESHYCEAIVKAVANELGLPCQIVTKDKDEARQALEQGKADIILADNRDYQNPACFVSKNVIQYSQANDSSITETRMIGKDRQLVETLDDEFTRLKESGYISLIQERWTHPERAIPEAQPIGLYIAYILFALAAILLLLMLLLTLHNRRTCRNANALREIIRQVPHLEHFYDVEDNQAAHDLIHKYDAILCNPFVAISFYDHNGRFIIENDAMRQLGEKDTTSYRQPLYNADGEVTNYFVAIRRPATT